jgi:hypothetical protein
MCYRHKLIVAAAIAVGVFAQMRGEERSLHYGTVSVQARLDSEGVLHVSERQEIIFTGDWNGGERTFRVQGRQSLRLVGIARLVDGRPQPLVEGDLSTVDSFRWVDSSTLRWRSRLPSDPPFDNTAITYVIDYTLSNILIPRGEGYLLDHDFAFPDRPGRIDRFEATLTVDPPWESGRPIGAMRASPLEPGQGYVLSVPLTYAGPGAPGGVIFGASKPLRYGFFAAFLAALALFSALFYLSEKSVGRFARYTPGADIDESWLQENVFRYPAEVVGAAWDGKIGPAEVAAVLARMEVEKKIRSEVKTAESWFRSRPVLHLTLLAKRDELEGYEEALVKRLFFKGDTTDTESLNRHYRNTGFDPAALISKAIEQRVDALTNERARPDRSRKLTWPLALLGLLLLVAAGFFRPYEIPIIGVVAVVTLILHWIARVAALSWQKRVVGLVGCSSGFVIPLALLLGGVGWLVWTGAWQVSGLLLAGSVVLCLAALSSVLNAAKVTPGPDWVLVRKKFAAGREYFRRELGKPDPRLEDQWFPYLVAFGLGANVDRWFKTHGLTIERSYQPGRSEATSTQSSSTFYAPRWSGGGGLSGGAGAGRSWTVAAGTIAAGVSAARSSGGGGSSGSSSGGSSGGGGGGGW